MAVLMLHVTDARSASFFVRALQQRTRRLGDGCTNAMNRTHSDLNKKKNSGRPVASSLFKRTFGRHLKGNPLRLGGNLRRLEGKGKGKVLGRSPNSSVSVIPTCPKAQHATSYYTHQNSRYSGTVNSRET